MPVSDATFFLPCLEAQKVFDRIYSGGFELFGEYLTDSLDFFNLVSHDYYF